MAENSELTNTDIPFEHGPYIVLSDCSTYDRADDAFIAILTQDGEDHLSDANDFKSVFEDDAKCVSLGDLIDAYNKVHGTTF